MDFAKIIMPLVVTAFSAFSASYLAMRIEIALLKERLTATRESHEERVASLEKLLRENRADTIASVSKVESDLDSHKDKIYARIDKILEELKEMRQEMHTYILTLNKK